MKKQTRVPQNDDRYKQVEHVVLMVKHHDPVGTHTDRTLGMVIVGTATALQAPGISTQEWFPIRKGPGMKAGDAPQGKVHVKVRYARVRASFLCRSSLSGTKCRFVDVDRCLITAE